MAQTPSLRPFIVFAAAAIVLSPSLTTPSAEPSAEFTELVEVSEVLLDVLVTDTRGNVVLGLGKDDFIIEEDGDELEASGVFFYSNRILLADEDRGRVPHAGPTEVIADRHFILFFDDQRMAATDNSRLLSRQLAASRESQRWVREEMLQGDWVAVVSYDHALEVHQDFTQDRNKIVRAINTAATSKKPTNTWSSRREEHPSLVPSLLANLPEGRELRDQSPTTYEALELISEATHDISGRKNVLMFTIGFGDLRALGRGAFFSEPDRRHYPSLEHSLNDNNVAVYPIDLTPSGFEHAQESFLHQLASDTGGYYYSTSVNFAIPLREIANENSGYYLLSYQAEHEAGAAGYRDVEVRARNPDLRVRARRGYKFGPS